MMCSNTVAAFFKATGCFTKDRNAVCYQLRIIYLPPVDLQYEGIVNEESLLKVAKRISNYFLNTVSLMRYNIDSSVDRKE